MKKLVALAGAFALAACGGNDAEETAVAEPEPVEAVDTASSAGTYAGTDENGVAWTSTLNADGTFEDTENGEVVRTGTWEDNDRGTCFITEGDDVEACFTMGEVQGDGTVEVTGPEGETFTMTKTG